MFKWDPFEGTGTPDVRELSRQVTKVQEVREAVGNDYQLAIDAHNRFSVDGAIMAARALESPNIRFFEAPTEDNSEMLQRVADATSIPLATGELTITRRKAKELLDSSAIKIFQPEVGLNGGILESCKTGDLAELYDVLIAPHHWCGPIVMRAATHVCARTSNLFYQEYAGGVSKNDWEHELLDPRKQIEEGHLILPRAQGLASNSMRKYLVPDE